MRAPIKRSQANIPQKPRSGASVALARVVSPQEVLTLTGGAPTALEAAFLALLQSKTAPPLPIDRRIFLTMAESAEFTGLPAAFLRRLVATGKIAALRTGAGWRIARLELEKLSGALTETPTDLTEHQLRDLEVNRRRRQGIARPSDAPPA